jgi:tRNA(adenine34) deaminase
MIARRALLGGLVCVAVTPQARAALPSISREAHERNMRLAIEMAKGNPRYPFGAVIVKPATGEVMARGVNNSGANPMLHGETACMNDYIARHGNKGWADCVLYTTGEPCAMCMSALVWAGIGATVFASPIDTLRRAGIDQIGLRASAVIEASPFYKGLLVGGVLAEETDRIFMERPR